MMYYHEGNGMNGTAPDGWVAATLARLDEANTPPWHDATSERTAPMSETLNREALVHDLALVLHGVLHPAAEVGPPARLASRRIADVLGIEDGEMAKKTETRLGTALDEPKPHWHDATGHEDTPCWCPSPGTYAPQGNGTYGSEEAGQ